MKVCASQYGGPNDHTGTHGYRGDLLTGRSAYAELGMGTLLGALPYKQRARITYNGKSVVAEKLDIGGGGAGCGGFPRGLDLWWETANAIGFNGLGVVDFQLVDSATPLTTGGTTGTDPGATANPVGFSGTASNTLKFLKALADPNFWKRAGLGMLAVLLIGIGAYFMLSKEPGSFKPVRKLTENVP